jgi:TetR/AcrR family fatty acid metabolism transcriptional regulator
MDTPEPSNEVDRLQEQLIAAKRNQILDAAVKVFAEKGFHKATIRDVARAAGVADGTIYNYFENKPALMLGILNRLNETERREDDIAQSTDLGVRDFTSAYVKQRLALIGDEQSAVLRVLLSEMLVNKELRTLYMEQIIQPTFALAEKYYQTWLEQGSVKPSDGSLVLRAFSGMALGLLVLRLLGDPQLESRWDELPDLLAAIFLDGVSQGGHNESGGGEG